MLTRQGGSLTPPPSEGTAGTSTPKRAATPRHAAAVAAKLAKAQMDGGPSEEEAGPSRKRSRGKKAVQEERVQVAEEVKMEVSSGSLVAEQQAHCPVSPFPESGCRAR